jgi:putative transposase
MSNHIRPSIPAATIYFTVALQQRGSDLLILEIERLRQAVRVTRAERPFQIEAWVVLPDHLHTIWTLPDGDSDFATRWRLIKSRFSSSLPAGLQRPSQIDRQERGIWQRRFCEHHIRNAADFDLHMRHCWLDPVRHGLVDNPEDWPYTSFKPRQVLLRTG